MITECSDTKSVRIGPFIAKIWLFSELDLHFNEHSENTPYVRKWAVQKNWYHNLFVHTTWGCCRRSILPFCQFRFKIVRRLNENIFLVSLLLDYYLFDTEHYVSSAGRILEQPRYICPGDTFYNRMSCVKVFKTWCPALLTDIFDHQTHLTIDYSVFSKFMNASKTYL